MFMKELNYLEYLPEDAEQDRQVSILLVPPPVPQRKPVAFHNDHIAALCNPIVVDVGYFGIKPKVFQTTDLSEDVVEHTSLIDTVGEVHLLYCNFVWAHQVSATAEDCSITTLAHLFPFCVQTHICEGTRQQLQ